MSQQIYQFGASRAETAGYQLMVVPGVLHRIDGYNNGAHTWLQIFDSLTAPVTNDVPLKSLELFANDGFAYTFLGMDEVTFVNGLYFALSTSEVNYQADGSGTKISGDATVEDLGLILGATKVGPTDLSTVSGIFDVWAPNETHKLCYVRLGANGAPAATKTWLAVCAVDQAAAAGNIAPMVFIPLFTTLNSDGSGTVTNLANKSFNFGLKDSGLYIFGASQATAPPIILAPCYGCMLFITSTASPAGAGIANLNVRTDATTLTAYYK